jgi:hypothetical protein
VTKFDDNPNIECLTWETAQGYVQATNPELYEILNAWKPGPEYKLYRVVYRYGDHILNDGVFQLPARDGKLYPLTHPEVSPQLVEDLGYRLLPLGLLTKNDSEVFLQTQDRLISLALFYPGKLIGLWECLDPEMSFFPKRVWYICAGSRSVFMVPKISETGSHNRLCKMVGVRRDPPKTIMDHQPIFVDIARCLQSDWRHEIIYFSKEWFKEQEDNPHWLRFHHSLLKEGWLQSSFNRNKLTFDRVWDLFTMHLGEDSAKASSYLIDTLKQLIGIASKAYPGFRSPGTNESAAPIGLIQNAYIEHYQLKHYFPTMMCPAYFDLNTDTQPIYYSLQMPTCLGSHPKTKIKISYMDELRIIKSLVNRFVELADSGTLKIEGTLIEVMISHIRIDYFHSDQDLYGDILTTDLLPNRDKGLLTFNKDYSDREFATSGTFLRGLIRIMKRVCLENSER